MQSFAVPAFRDLYLSTTKASEGNSSAIPVSGNACALSVLVKNASGTPAATVKLQGSYDGQAWEDVTGGSITSLSVFGHSDIVPTAIDYAYIRVKAETTSGGTRNILLDATVAFSEQ